MTDFQIKMHFLLVSMRYVRNDWQGICFNLVDHSLECPEIETQGKENNDWLHPAFNKWKYFSGYDRCPVPHPTLGATKGFVETQNKWTGEYGKKRKELLEFLIEEIQKDE